MGKTAYRNSVRIRLVGDINDDLFAHFSDKMDEIECSMGSDKVAVNVILSSDGGSALVALAIYDRMRLSPFDVCVTVYGRAYSAATIILAGADKRRMTKNSWVMVHEDSSKITGEVRELEREAAQLRRQETQWNQLLAQHTRVIVPAWDQMNKQTTYLNAEECLDLGLIDEVI